jgi:hypothetical protein
MQSWFEGDFEGFKKTHGNAYFCNVLAYLTRQHEHKKNKMCQGIPGVHEPHTFEGNITLAHPMLIRLTPKDTIFSDDRRLPGSRDARPVFPAGFRMLP